MAASPPLAERVKWVLWARGKRDVMCACPVQSVILMEWGRRFKEMAAIIPDQREGTLAEQPWSCSPNSNRHHYVGSQKYDHFNRYTLMTRSSLFPFLITSP